MDIFSFQFVALVVVSVILFYFIKARYRIAFMVILSLIFISSFNLLLVPYIIIYSLINYYIGLHLPTSGKKVFLFRVGIILNLGQLILLRYSSFLIDPIFQIFNSDIYVSRLSEILVPVGISYFTLQGIGYLYNIKMGWEKPEKRLVNFFLYIIFFPKFLSGPIERSNHFLTQLNNLQSSFNRQEVVQGLKMILIGFFKKDIIANQLSLIVDPVYTDIDSSWGWILWVTLLIQPLYLYFDFSGYTDIALGFARVYGIKLLPNFNRPFFSENMTTFWKRFHISLSSWFHDYVFRPVSFKHRKWGIYAAVYSLLITWVLFGIWHGAGLNFMVLGLLQAIAIIYEFFTKKWRVHLFSRLPPFLRIWFSRLITYVFYGVSLVFFYASDLNSALKYFVELKDFNISSRIGILDKSALLAAVIFMTILLILEFFENDKKETFKKIEKLWISNQKKYSIPRYILYYIMIVLIFYFGGLHKEFIYFQF